MNFNTRVYYWQIKANNIYKNEFNNPVIISCFFENISKLVISDGGEELIAKACIITNNNLTIGSYVGDINNYNSNIILNHKIIANSIIKSISGNLIEYKYWLI